MLQTTYTQHEDVGGYTQQSIRKVVKFKMGSECKYNQNNSIGIKLLCSRIRGTCLGEITPITNNRSPHAQKLNTELNSACRAVTGCLQPTNVEDLYLLAGIAPPDIRRDVCANILKALAGTSWGQQKETLLMTYKAV